ncbi:hypothetical protein DICVIV_00275 [Dictyocaulus viviparus]|uniref:PIN domain-containing protein n=1 Tax=Dictyocaulus viviparus TaxID=29172 RepID=A0A0D8Y9V1_DICVI|nr:hypothetical protein DICVIV_00275 [Dictyocaulus viviparus]
MFLKFNNQLGPPFRVLIDTNFVNFAVKNRMDVIQGFRDCLYAHTIPYITDCVLGELEKAGRRFKIALKVIKDSRFQRLKCDHKGTYADDCLVQRVIQLHILLLCVPVLQPFYKCCVPVKHSAISQKFVPNIFEIGGFEMRKNCM